MQVGNFCKRAVVVADRETGIQSAAQLMREYHVGSVVVVERDGERARPVGVVTDRDLVVEVLAAEVGADQVSVGDVMGERLLTANETDDLSETLESMRNAGVRRLPVVGAAGELVGILTMDDALESLIGALGQIPQLIRREQQGEAALRC